MKVFLSCVRLGFVHRFVYRMEVLSAFLSAVVVVVLTASVWGAVGESAGEIGGLGASELSTYVIVAWLVGAAAATRLDALLATRFRSGQIAADLSRPLDLELFLVGRDLGRGIGSMLVTAVPVMILVSTVFPFVWPAHWWTWGITAVAVVNAVAVNAIIAFMVGIFAFRLKNITGLTFLKASLTGLLSGSVVPLDAFPDWARTVVSVLPFQAIAHVPTTLFLEQVPASELWRPIGLQLVWLGILLLVSRFLWSWAIDHLTVQGG